MIRRLTIRSLRSRLVASCAISLLVHAALLAAAVGTPQWFVRQLPAKSPVFAGNRQVITIQSAWATSQPVTQPVTIVAAEPVQVSPREAVVEHQRLVATPAAELPLPALDLPIVEAAIDDAFQVERQPSRDEPTAAAEVDVAIAVRRPAAMPPVSAASVAALPQTAGLDPTQPPSFAGNRPPNYPLVAQQRGWQGTVLLRLVIDERGRVTEVTVERSSGFEVLDAEAVAAVRGWQGTPARRNGTPLATQETLPVRFRLR